MSGKSSNKSKVEKAIPKPAEQVPFLRWFLSHIFSLIRRHGDVVAFWVGVGYCVRQLSLAFQAFAGRASFADLKLAILANVSFVWTVSISATGISIALYFRERRLHSKTRLRLANRIKELELKIDPIRTSSNLTPEGLTRKEDE